MHLTIEIGLTIFYGAVFCFIFIKAPFFRLDGVNNKILPALLLLKIALGTAIALIYTYYYPDRLKADVFKYFDDSKVMYDALFTKPFDYIKMLLGIGNDSPYFDSYYTQMNNWYRQYESNIYNDSHIIIRFNAFVRLFSFGYFSVHTAFMSFVALAGQTAVFKFFRKNTTLTSWQLLLASFLIPSVLFWSSGVLKEGLLFLGMGFLLHFSFKLQQKFNVVAALWTLISIILLAYLKFYIMASLLPLLLTYFWCLKTKNRMPLLKYGIVLSLLLVAGFNFHYIFTEFNLPEIMVNKQNDFYYLALDQDSGSLVYIGKLKPHFASFILNTPRALFNVFFIPHVFMKQSLLSYLSSFENLGFLLLLLMVVFHIKTKNNAPAMLWLCLCFVVFTFALVGLITPVYGAIVRYKTPALPFLLVLLFMLIDNNKIQNTYSRFIKRKS